MTRIITQNVMCAPEMPQDKVKHDVELTGQQADIVCWQEIQEPRYLKAIYNLGKEWGHYSNMDMGGCPISWRKDMFEFVDGGSTVMYPTTPFISRTRKVVWAKLRHLRTGKILVVVNCHFVAGAYSAGSSLIRRVLWRRCRKVLIRTVSRFVRQGHAVVVCGDTNRRDFRHIGRFIEMDDNSRRPVFYPVPLDEIDQVILINGEDLVFGISNAVYEKKRGRNSDHQGNQVEVSIRKRNQ